MNAAVISGVVTIILLLVIIVLLVMLCVRVWKYTDLKRKDSCKRPHDCAHDK